MSTRRPRIITPFRARKLGTVKGKPVLEFPVLVEQSWLSAAELYEDKAVVRVISHNARDAAELVHREIAHVVDRPTQITVVGPAGGVAAHRFIGYDSMVWAGICRSRPAAQQTELF